MGTMDGDRVPEPQPASQAVPPQPAAQTPPAPVRRFNWPLAIIGALLALCLCIGVSGVAFLTLDPLRLHLLERLTGRYDPVARAIPADAPVIAQLDLLAVANQRTDKLIAAFSGLPGAGDVNNTDDALSQLDDALNKELGLTFTDDIKPWLGQYVALAITEIPTPGTQEGRVPAGRAPGLAAGNPPDLKFVAAVETRDQARSDAFVTRLIDGVQTKTGKPSSSEVYQGVTVYTLEPETGEGQWIVARSGDLVLLGNDLHAMQRVIDTQGGRIAPLADLDAYQELRNRLPKERALTVMLTGETLLGLTESLMGTLGEAPFGSPAVPSLPPEATQQYEAVRVMALSVSVVDDGVRVDVAAVYDEGKLTETQLAQMQATGADMMLPWMPEHTVLYASGSHFDLAWQSYKETLTTQLGAPDFDEAMSSFEETAGFNPEELFAVLNGGYALVVLPDEGGLFSVVSGADGPTFGMAVVAETSDENAVLNLLDRMNERLTSMSGGDVAITTRALGGVDAYLLGMPDTEESILAYGVGRGHLALATSSGLFADIHDGGVTVTDTEVYQFVHTRFPQDVPIALYVDLRGTIDMLRSLPGADTEGFDEQAGVYLAPFKAIAMGTRYSDAVSHMTLVVYVEKPAP